MLKPKTFATGATGNRLRQFAPESAMWRCEQVMARPQRRAALAGLCTPRA